MDYIRLPLWRFPGTRLGSSCKLSLAQRALGRGWLRPVIFTLKETHVTLITRARKWSRKRRGVVSVVLALLVLAMTVAAVAAPGTRAATQLATTAAAQGGGCGKNNAAVDHPTTASSIQDDNPAYSPSYATDGSTVTRWSSASSDQQWLQVDLGARLPVCKVVINWENAYATAFDIQISNDKTNWTTIYSTTKGLGGIQTMKVAGTGRYIRMDGIQRATGYGYSIWEFGAYTVGGVVGPIPQPRHKPAPGTCPWLNEPKVPVATRVAQLMSAMTEDQKDALLHGDGSTVYIGQIAGQPSLCIPNVNLEDGPLGVGDGLGGVTQMPDGEASAATFDPSYMRAYGAAIGKEFAGKGVNASLGPTINMVRDSRWGRSYETLGEDPYLTGELTAADVEGIQSQGVMAVIKHAAAYNIEQPAGTIVVSQRVLREIYLPAFQTAIEKGGAAAVMCGYSNVNNVPSCQNPTILNGPLYKRAGFTGWVTSDWGGIHSTVASANAGETIEMPFEGYFGPPLEQAVADGQVSKATFNKMVTRVLTQMFRFGMFDRAPSGSIKAVVTNYAHAKVALRGVEEGTVLLKNNGVLPLNANGRESIAVIGADASNAVQTIGGGSGTSTSPGTYLPIYSIQQRLAGTSDTVTYDDGTNQASAVALAKASRVAIVFASDNYGHEEADNKSLNLPGNQDALISAVAAANPRTIVVLNDNAAIFMPWLNQVAGVFEGFYDGQEVGQGIAALLFGDIDPSGHLPITFPTSLSEVPASTPAQWPGTNNKVQYSEGLDIGYRWYDAHNVTPLFPFGYGLSYTKFGFSDLKVGAMTGKQATVTVTVTNTGKRAGTEVAQLYVGDPSSAGEPPHQLKGFKRITLKPGRSGTLTFTVTAHDLASWSKSGNWIAGAGSYRILIGDSSRHLPLSGTITLGSAITDNAMD
jgi:beta-glucosidase